MPKSMKVKVGNKAKGRQHAKSLATGKYQKQAVRTEINRRRKRLKHYRNNPHDNTIRGFPELMRLLNRE